MSKLSKYLMVFLFLGTSLNSTWAAVKKEPILPLKKIEGLNPEKIELGKMLFFDPRLSKSGIISCNSCHNLSLGGTDNLSTSIGHQWTFGPINSPTVLNSAYNFVQFWDGRAKDLKEQASGPIANPKEMALPHDIAVKILHEIPTYRKKFQKIYKSPKVSIDMVADAIAEFEKTLITTDSKFDKWLSGDEKALNKEELMGYQNFKQKGCISCHNGSLVGGNSYQKLGLIKPYKTKALGRFDVTKKEEDKYFFKVPTLRNIELTYPYFHDGSIWSLSEAVEKMAFHQLGQTLSPKENSSIVAFLKTLTGKRIDIKMPILPPTINHQGASSVSH